MSTYPKSLQAVTAFVRRVKESFSTRKHRVLDERDQAIIDALGLLEARSDDHFPSVTEIDASLTLLPPRQVVGAVITGANLVGAAEKATGVTTLSTGELTFTAVLPGRQTITVTIEDTGAALAVTADAAAGTIDIVHGLGGSGAGGLSTAAEMAAALNAALTEANYMVQVTASGAGDMDADETVTVTTVGDDPGVLPVLQIGPTAVDGSSRGYGISSWTDTEVLVDFDGAGLTPGDALFLRLWVDGVLVVNSPLIVDVEDVSGTYFEIFEDFALIAGGTLPGPHAKDMQTANITGDYLADAAGGVYEIAHDATGEAQSGQVTWNNQLMIDPTKSPIFEARVRLNFAGATFSADQRAVIGLCSDHTNAEDALDAVVSNVWFRIEGASLNILAESDDGANDDDDNDTGFDIVDNAWTIFRIDMTDLDAVKFYVDGELSAITLDAGALTGSNLLQPIFCIQRDAGAELEKLDVDWYRVRAFR